MDCSTPGFSVLHHLLELAQTHVHWVSDAIQPSCPLLSPSPPAFNPFQHQGLFLGGGSFLISWLFASGGQSTGASVSASILLKNTQDWFPLWWTDWISLQSKDSQESSPPPHIISLGHPSAPAPSTSYNPIKSIGLTLMLEKALQTVQTQESSLKIATLTWVCLDLWPTTPLESQEVNWKSKGTPHLLWVELCLSQNSYTEVITLSISDCEIAIFGNNNVAYKIN